jgi:hypothetical protein
MLDDEGVREVSRMTSLTTLRLTGNSTGSLGNVTDLSVEALSRMTGLTSLSVPEGHAHDVEGPIRVGELSRLTSLTVC